MANYKNGKLYIGPTDNLLLLLLLSSSFCRRRRRFCFCCCWKLPALVLGTGITFTWRKLLKRLCTECNASQSVSQPRDL
jgi:hypothetical protein